MRRSLRLAHAEEDVFDSGKKRWVEDKMKRPAMVLLIVLSLLTIIPSQPAYATSYAVNQGSGIKQKLADVHLFGVSYYSIPILNVPVPIEVSDEEWITWESEVDISTLKIENVHWTSNLPIFKRWEPEIIEKKEKSVLVWAKATIFGGWHCYFEIWGNVLASPRALTKLTVLVNPAIGLGEETTITGKLTYYCDGMGVAGREIHLWDWNVDTGKDGTIAYVTTESDGSYSSKYSFTSIGLHEIQAIFQGDADLGDIFARAKSCVGVTVKTTALSPVEHLKYTWFRTDNRFLPEEIVFVKGCGLGLITTYQLYVIEDTEWSDGMKIPKRVKGTETEVKTDEHGYIAEVITDEDGRQAVIPAGTAWISPLIPGKYDIIIDVNNNGKYDEGIDAIYDVDIEVTGFFVIPELPLGTILSLATCIIALGVFKSKRVNLKHI